MPLFIGTRGSEILRWNASSQLVSTLRGLLSEKWERQSLQEAASLLRTFQGGLDRELSCELEAQEELEGILLEMDRARSTGDLAALSGRGEEFALRYFQARQSVLAHFEICSSLHDRVVARAIALAYESMRSKGKGKLPAYALLVSGERGRGEHVVCGGTEYFLLHEDAGDHHYLFVHGVAASLREAGVMRGNTLWHGTLEDWEAYLAGPRTDTGANELQQEQRLETLADLAHLMGEAGMAREALALAREAVQRERDGELVQRLGRKAVAAPVAIGLFGRYRVQREGEHRGTIDLDALALAPLQATLRVLAINCGTGFCGCLSRINWLVERGELNVELAERLLKAFQVLVQLRLAAPGEEGRYLDPTAFDEEQDETFRAAVETVLTLQKIAYQKLFGQG